MYSDGRSQAVANGQKRVFKASTKTAAIHIVRKAGILELSLSLA